METNTAPIEDLDQQDYNQDHYDDYQNDGVGNYGEHHIDNMPIDDKLGGDQIDSTLGIVE